MSQRIRIKLKSYDHSLVDKSAEKIVKTVNAVKDDKVVVVGSSYKRLLDIYGTTAKTIDALMKLELPSGVEVEIKV